MASATGAEGFGRNSYTLRIALALALLLLAAPALAYTGDLVAAVDVDPDPKVFETSITADEALIDLDGDGSPDEVFAFNGAVPGPTIEVAVGDVVIVHFTNNLDSLASTIHWHGVEVNNESDGSPVAQIEVPPGGSFTYRFTVPHAGVAWYHPHIRPADQTFRGLYGAVIMTDPHEQTLAGAGVLPPLADARTVILSDVTVCTGGEASGVCAGSTCGAAGGEPCTAGDVPFVQPDFDCRLGGAGSCNVARGTTVLVNGAPLEPGDALEVSNGDGVRLRLINAAIFRYFRLVPPAGHQLFRVGGEGGLLDAVRLEGGVVGSPPFDTLYAAGEIVLAPGDRADVVLVPSGADQDVLTVTTGAYALTPGGQDVLRFELAGAPPASPYSIAAGDPLLTHVLVNDPAEVLPATGHDTLLDPATDVPGAPYGPAPRGSTAATVTFEAPVTTACSSSADCYPGTQCRDVDAGMGVDLLCPSQSTSPNCACVADGAGPAIDGVRGVFDTGSTNGPQEIPHPASSRWARVGNLLELKVYNATNNHHPFHLHGFAFQPVRIEYGLTELVLFTWDHAEFVDNIDVRPGHTLVFRVRLRDRPKLTDVGTGGGRGGAEGRWLFHCHIFTHAGLGMTSELVVLPSAEIFADGFETGDVAAWTSATP